MMERKIKHYDAAGNDIDIVDIMLVVKHWGETCG